MSCRERRLRTSGSVALCLAFSAALVLLAGCGVPVDRGPTAISRSGVPFQLLAPSSPSPSSTTTTSPSEIGVRIFLLGPSGHLVPVSRNVPAAQLSLPTVLAILADGPTQPEAASGIASAIPPQTTVLGANIAPGGLVTVNVGGTFAQLVGQAQIEAVAQIVFTVMTLPLPRVTVTGVTFQLSGQPVEVPVDSGALAPVVTDSQFASLAPQASSSR